MRGRPLLVNSALGLHRLVQRAQHALVVVELEHKEELAQHRVIDARQVLVDAANKMRQTVDVVELQLARLDNDAVDELRCVLLFLPRRTLRLRCCAWARTITVVAIISPELCT
jgi:hypothetical protein